MKKLAVLIPVFTVVFAVFFLGPPLLGFPLGTGLRLQVADAFDLLTPLALLPLYWLLFRYSREEPPALPAIIIFLVLAAIWVEGQGIHLAGNSIGRLLAENGGDVYYLTYFYDELLGHSLWHIGVFGLAALLIYREWRRPAAPEGVPLYRLAWTGFAHGFTIFLITIEGQTALLGLVFSALVLLLGFPLGRRRLGGWPLFTFFFISGGVAMLFFIGWGVYWGGFPQFSEIWVSS